MGLPVFANTPPALAGPAYFLGPAGGFLVGFAAATAIIGAAADRGWARSASIHLQPFMDAMHRRDEAGLAEHVRGDIVLNSPIFAEPFEGKEKVLAVLSLIVGLADDFEVTDMLTGETNAAMFITIRASEDEVQGVDNVHVDDDGLIKSMTIQWRPLAAIVAMQQRLAPKIGVPALGLVER